MLLAIIIIIVVMVVVVVVVVVVVYFQDGKNGAPNEVLVVWGKAELILTITIMRRRMNLDDTSFRQPVVDVIEPTTRTMSHVTSFYNIISKNIREVQ